MKSEQTIDELIRSALPAILYLQVTAEDTSAPVAWVDGTGRPDLSALTGRLLTIGDQYAHLDTVERESIYGLSEVQWMYVYRADASVFFLRVQVQMPTFARPFLELAAFQTQFVIAFGVNDDPTIALLRAIADSHSLMLHFDATPEWVGNPPPGSRNALGSDYSGHIRQLLRTGFPLWFRPDTVARMRAQLEQWIAYSHSSPM
jgi:hypothetical protein